MVWKVGVGEELGLALHPLAMEELELDFNLVLSLVLPMSMFLTATQECLLYLSRFFFLTKIFHPMF